MSLLWNNLLSLLIVYFPPWRPTRPHSVSTLCTYVCKVVSSTVFSMPFTPCQHHTDGGSPFLLTAQGTAQYVSAAGLCKSLLRVESGPWPQRPEVQSLWLAESTFVLPSHDSVLCSFKFPKSCTDDGLEAPAPKLGYSGAWLCLLEAAVGRELEEELAETAGCLGGWEAGSNLDLWRVMLWLHARRVTYVLSYKAMRMAIDTVVTEEDLCA